MHTAYTARTTVGICQFVNGIYEQHFRTAVPVRAPTNIRGVYMDKKTNIKDIISMAGGLDYINPKDIPSIDLYMDQLTTFMEDQLGKNRRNDEDKVMTKTMINNYAKNKLLPPPEKKRYSREHLLMLIFIYYFKNILSINDIQTLLTPIAQKYFKSMTEKDMTYIYNEVFSMEKEQIESLKKDLLRKYKTAQDTFGDADEEDQANLKRFSFICLLSFDVKKMMFEHIIDGMNPESEHNSKKKK